MFEPKTEAINNDIAGKARDIEYLKSIEEERKIQEIINPWIGIRHLHDEGRTVFASDKTTVAWSNWEPNEPNNVNASEDCVHFYNEKIEYACIKAHVLYIADGKCDDDFNNKECNWDGGDCCGNNVNKDKCEICECHAPDFEEKCDKKQIADGICNDDTNTEECKWDGGDCCGDFLMTEHNLGEPTDMTECSACECLEPFRWNDNNCDEYRRFICEKEGTGKSETYVSCSHFYLHFQLHLIFI